MKKFDIITHENGTHSLKELSSGEAMHSRIGPEQEAEDLYVGQSGLVERLLIPGPPFVLWDVGMGTAANALIALQQVRKSGATRLFEIHSFETELSGIKMALENSERFPFLKSDLALIHELLREKKVHADHFSWNLHEGDFFKNLASAPAADIIFYDFYAPKICPELWTLECFQKVRAAVGEHRCELYTYSASTAVRLALIRAGFYVGHGRGTDLKLESTVASTALVHLEKPLDEKWRKKLSSP